MYEDLRDIRGRLRLIGLLRIDGVEEALQAVQLEGKVFRVVHGW